jgi:poly(3-hydroxybutyrate) depolymerase
MGMAAAGVAAAVYGLSSNFAVLAAPGVLAAVLAIGAILLHRRCEDRSPRTHAARSAKVRAELVAWTAAVPLAVILIALALHPTPPRTSLVSGKPAEVRSLSRLVIMPDGRTFQFWCGSRQHPQNNCPALAKWRALPRWPEPEHVEMEVDDDRIYSLRMDGEVIVDKTVDNTGKGWRAMMALAGGALAVGAIRAIWRRTRQLSKLRSPGGKPRRA